MVECLNRMSARSANGKYLLSTVEIGNLITLCPTDDETKALKGYKGDHKRLGNAEQFMLAVLEVPAARVRAEGLHYQAGFDERVKDCQTKLNVFTAAIEAIHNAARLKRFLKVRSFGIIMTARKQPLSLHSYACSGRLSLESESIMTIRVRECTPAPNCLLQRTRAGGAGAGQQAERHNGQGAKRHCESLHSQLASPAAPHKVVRRLLQRAAVPAAPTEEARSRSTCVVQGGEPVGLSHVTPKFSSKEPSKRLMQARAPASKRTLQLRFSLPRLSFAILSAIIHIHIACRTSRAASC